MCVFEEPKQTRIVQHHLCLSGDGVKGGGAQGRKLLWVRTSIYAVTSPAFLESHPEAISSRVDSLPTNLTHYPLCILRCFKQNSKLVPYEGGFQKCKTPKNCSALSHSYKGRNRAMMVGGSIRRGLWTIYQQTKFVSSRHQQQPLADLPGWLPGRGIEC